MKSRWLKIALAVLFIVAVVWGGKLLGIDYRELSPDKIRSFILSFGVWAPLLYVVVYGQPIIPLPASLMTIAGGLAFGPWWGTLGAVSGATLRAATQFGVARLLGRDTVAHLMHGKVARFDNLLGENSFFSVWLIRTVPNFPYDMQNFALGFSRVRFVPYIVATFVGILPASFAYVYFGHSLSDPKQIWKLFVAVLLIAALALGAKRLKSRRDAKLPKVIIEEVPADTDA